MNDPTPHTPETAADEAVDAEETTSEEDAANETAGDSEAAAEVETGSEVDVDPAPAHDAAGTADPDADQIAYEDRSGETIADDTNNADSEAAEANDAAEETGEDDGENTPANTDEADSAEDEDEASEPIIQSTTELEPAEPAVEDEDSRESQMQWFVLKVISNREKSVKDNIERRIRLEGLDDYFDQVVIPVEKTKTKTKTGKTRTVERKLYPGYMMIRMILNEDTWFLVRDTNGVGDFAGSAGKPIPMEEDEVRRMLGQETAPADEGEGDDEGEGTDEQIHVRIPFSVGDVVKINDGSFVDFEGVITDTDTTTGKIIVEVTILGQPTPVELEYYQVSMN